jgi:hypothetical protein
MRLFARRKLNGTRFLEVTRALIGLPVSDLQLRSDSVLRLEFGEMSYFDDVLSWGEAGIVICPGWEIQGPSGLRVDSTMSFERLHGKIILNNRTIEEISLGDSRTLEIELSGEVRIRWLGEDGTRKDERDGWTITLPESGLITLRQGVLQYDPSFRCYEGLL